MYIIKIHRCTKLAICWACKEIQAAISSKDIAGLLYNSSYWRITKNIVVSCPPRNRKQLCYRVFIIACIDKMKFNPLFCIFCYWEKLLCPVQALLVQICYYNHSRAHITVQSICQRPKPHRTSPCHNRKFSIFPDSHLMFIYPHLGMVCRIKRTNAAGHRLCQGSLIISTPFIFQQAAKLHYFRRNNTVCCISPKKLIGISRTPHRPFIV